MNSKTCVKCGAEMLDGALFCTLCGCKQPEASTSLIEEQGLQEPVIQKFVRTGKKKSSTKKVEDVSIVDDTKIKKLDFSKKNEEDIKYEEVIVDDEITTLDERGNVIIDESKYMNKAIAGKEMDFSAQEKDEEFQKLYKRLREISIDEKMEELLYPLISPNVKGFKCIFSGNAGTAKEDTLFEIAKLLHDAGKISKDTPEWIQFGDMPEKFESDKMYVIDDLENAITRLFNLDDLSDEAAHASVIYKGHMENLLKSARTSYVFLTIIPPQLKGFLRLDPRLPFIFSNIAVFPDLNNKQIYDVFYEALPEFHKQQLPFDYKENFLGYLERNRRFFPFNNRELGLYLAQTASKQQEFKLPKEKYNSASLEETFSKIIGMESVKEQVYELAEFLRARKRMEEHGAKLPNFRMHMMFLGNPGVGKTTIARIISKTLFDLGYIREDKLIEVTSKDLVGAHGNQTGLKTNKAILSALGGILFVDEAYSLSQSCGQAGAEVIANLIKAMEDYHGELIVMFAGYTLEMGEFVKSNSGIASRIAYTFQFQDYNNDELYAIFELNAKKAGMTIAPDAVRPIKKIIEWGSGRKNFGNGRYIEKLFQRTLTKHAMQDIPDEEILVLHKNSIPDVEEIMKTFGRFLG